MDIQQAFEILEIDLNTIKLTDVTHEYIKKRYHKLALINHPDKNGNNLNATNKFQQINEAYDLLSKELGEPDNDFVSSYEDKTVNNRYIIYHYL